MKTKIKILEETLQKKDEEIEALRKKEYNFLEKKKQRFESSQAKALNLRISLTYWEALQNMEFQLPESEFEAVEAEFELLESMSNRLRDQVWAEDQKRMELQGRVSMLPEKKKQIELMTKQLQTRLKGFAKDFETVRAELGLEWLDFAALEDMLKDFRKEMKPKVNFLKETLE